ncbi:hypothetical protein COY27_03640 [Candidatus Woesearchaeota archaeon CG_4_10_14_0_2_um_filter_33_13]|nr:MAG: hypothetical protein COY27_03640 [Candidatus Woesearchaeota archaeon CG_4_10_14_0_2_um_filter_33_13]
MVVKKRGSVVLVLALFALILISTPISAEVAGCYVYPTASEDLYCVPGVLDTIAKEDCLTYPGCDINQHFLPGANCADLTECKEITCNADCQIHTLGKCLQLGGQAITDAEYDLWCSPGCCKVADKFCQFNLLKFSCEDKAKKLGVTDKTKIFFDNAIGMNTQTCNQQYCQIDVQQSNLLVQVSDDLGNKLSGVKVTLEGTGVNELTDDNGVRLFAQINPGSYSVKATLLDYSTAIAVVSVPPGKTTAYNLTLIKQAGVAKVLGTVKNDNMQVVADATISWKGPKEGSMKTNSQGSYEVSQLPAGDYQFTASKIGFKSQIKPLTLTAGTFPINFQLEPAGLQGISGKVYIDTNNNKIFDSADQPKNDAEIYVDDVFKGRSQYPGGSFAIEISVSAEQEEHTIAASFLTYQFETETFKIKKGESIQNKILLLTAYIGECTEPDTEKEAENFTGKPVVGEKQIRLEWTKPCPEVIGYEIKKIYAGQEIDSLSAPPSVNYLIDANVEWGEEYSYRIVAHYDKARAVENTNEITVNVGDKRCEGRYSQSNGWETFCILGDKEQRKQVYTCTNLNQLSMTENCAERDGDVEDYYCSPITTGLAGCRDAGGCGLYGQSADPFGLYYSRSSCYGTDTPELGAKNYCYFDYTNTIIDTCDDCTKVYSCFDYKSKDACTLNNCLGAKCSWVDGASNVNLIDYSLIGLPTQVTPETGAGYCVEEKYPEEDYCDLCNQESPFFENYFCTADVCSGLGRCFSTFEVDECRTCGQYPSKEKNCYEYSTELECVNNQEFDLSPLGEITLSDDRCGWGRCFWDQQPNGFSEHGCFKDGNGDFKDDCIEFVSAGERQACEIDNSAPKTKIIPEGINVISLAKSNISFLGDDSYHPHGGQKNKMGVLGLCIVEASSNADNYCEDDFTIFPYPGKDDAEIIAINLLNTSYLGSEEINGETRRVKYYSEDIYYNRESLKDAFVYVDNVPPKFEIKESIETSADITTLSVYLEKTNEIMACDFKLNQLIPQGESQTVSVPREEVDKAAIFENMKALTVNLTVTCTDDQGNKNTKEKSYTFDLQQNIDIISPEMYGAVSTTEIYFEVETSVGATCGLYLSANNEKVADFVSDPEGKKHKTIAVSGFVEGEYAAIYKVACSDLLQPEKVYEDYFHFTVDFTPPKTQIILTEGTREVKPLNFGWEEFFIESAIVNFECTAEGFECDKTYYCLGEDCDFIENEKFQEFSEFVELLESTYICYYSTDLGNNTIYQPLCGQVNIEGFGITLEKPTVHYYQEEQWGISNVPKFEFQFFTKVPTVECRIDFTSGFVYESVPAHKIRSINAEGKYLFVDFPESVFSPFEEDCNSDECIKRIYIKCKNSDNQIGPEAIINLEYDFTAPEILDAYAEPDKIYEGISTELFVNTDDKTLCKYSDISEGEGSSEYGNMEYSFPGTEDLILKTLHQETFNLGFSGPSKEYTLATQCKNGAGGLSTTEEIKFLVDYSQKGYILPESLLPQGFVWTEDVTLSLQTSKNALCSYNLEGEGYLPFETGAYTTTHSSSVIGLIEGEYDILVKCVMGDYIDHETIHFIIDRTAPEITNVEDGNYTCGKDQINVMVYSTELNGISKYIYEVYDAGNAEVSTTNTTFYNTTNSSTSSGQMVLNGEYTEDLPLEISTSTLTAGKKYNIKVKATDLAGNEGAFAESNGVSVVDSNFSICAEDTQKPTVEFIMNSSSCTAVQVELLCQDEVGCSKLLYGKHGTSSLCTSNITYSGSKLSFDQNSWLCYYAEDNSGNNHTDQKKITFVDEDGDGVADHCDECAGTPGGKEVNAIGCADGEVSAEQEKEDTDGDSLPDIWEKTFDAFDCSLNYASVDSDDNSITDNLEDYDSDGYSNYEEYKVGYNPCIADTPAEIVEEETTTTTETDEKTTASGEEFIPSSSAEGSLVPWIFFIMGLLMVIGGTGYLIYYYKYSPAAQGGPKITAFTGTRTNRFPERPGVKQEQVPGKDWSSKLEQLRKGREGKLKERKRQSVFGEFNKQSNEIPHIEELLSKKVPHLDKVQDLAQKYVEHKEEIKPGLKPEEKSIFNKLEQISDKTKNKDIAEIVSKEEAKDIFSKLKDISKKRKEK